MNHGQTNRAADFIARGLGCRLFLNSTEAVLTTKNGLGSKLKLLNAKASPADATGLLESKSNYFIGNNPSQWRTDIPNYSRVRYRGVYPGIDVVYYGNQRRIEYDFVVSPHSDPRQIRLAFEGAEEIAVDEQGDLLLNTGGEQLRMRAPVIYQETNGARRQISGRYILLDNNSPSPTPHSPLPTPAIGFQIADYDANAVLIIDPVLEYSTFYGGGGTDVAYGIAVDRQGSAYITGQTSSLNFPTKNAFDPALNGASDAFVVKLNPQGNAVVFSTYIGGRNPGDRGWAIAVDQGGNVYFTGETTSLNFPTHRAAQPNFRGGVDAFATKLSIQGNVLLYSTYLGGSFTDAAYSIALDRFDNAYITGRTDSSNFPTKNPLQGALSGQRDAFVSKLSPDGEILFSTYLGGEPAAPGGRDEEAGYGIALDVLQNVYVTGYTTSPNFPLVNPTQRDFGGDEDAFVTKLNSTGPAIIYSTFIGGSRLDNGRGIAVNRFGDAYITGYTLSSDFPRANALQPAYGGGGDGFVTKLNGAGALVYSTFLGGGGGENIGPVLDPMPGCAIAVDALGFAYVTGKTASQDFPVVFQTQTGPIQAGLLGDTDAFIAKLDPAGSALVFSTYLGSTGAGGDGFEERGLGIALGADGGVYVTGQILKSDFPTLGPAQNIYGGGPSDAFISKITTPDIVTIAPVSAASFNGAALAPESIVAAFGMGLAGGTESAKGVPLPTTLQGASLKIKDAAGGERAAPLFFVSPNQTNFLIPAETAPGKATITVTNPQNVNISATVWIDNAAPGLFSANAGGQGLAAAVALRIRQDGSFSFEPVAQLNDLGSLVAVPIDLGDASDQVFLILFGSGFRRPTSLEKVSVQIGGVNLPAMFAGAQGDYIGQDQVNVRLPRSLAGSGNVPVTLIMDGQLSNQVSVNIR